MDVAAKYIVQPNGDGGLDLVSGFDLINQSILDILETPIGSRFGREDYGSYIHLLIFEQNDSVLESLLYYYITSALEKWENRIRVEDLTFNRLEEGISCKVLYTLLNTMESSEYQYLIKR